MNNTTPDHVISWLNYVEKFNPNIHIDDTVSWLDCLEESVLCKDKQVFFLKDSFSKGMNFADDTLLIKCFLHIPPYQSVAQIQWTISGYLPNKLMIK